MIKTSQHYYLTYLNILRSSYCSLFLNGRQKRRYTLKLHKLWVFWDYFLILLRYVMSKDSIYGVIRKNFVIWIQKLMSRNSEFYYNKIYALYFATIYPNSPATAFEVSVLISHNVSIGDF